MMNNRIKRVFCVLLASGLLLGTSGCTDKKQTVAVEPMEAEEVNTLTFAATGGEDVMPIAGYFGPADSTYSYEGEKQPNFITDEYFQMIEESGINLLNHSYVDYESQPENVIKLLKLGEKYHLGICVNDSAIVGPYAEDTMPVKNMSDRINEYGNYPAFCGLYVVDEPQWAGFHLGDGSRTVDMYAPILKNLSELGIYGYANAVPDNGHSGKDEFYDDYLDYFIESGNLPYLSYDSYVWDRTAGHEVTNYFYNLSMIRDRAQAHGIPFWVFIQAGSQWNDAQSRFDSELPYYPNEKQFQWTVNVNLAYGAQGLQYFTLFQPNYFSWAESEPFDFRRNGMIGAWGNKNEWYYYAQTVNKQVAAVDHVLMHAKNKGVIVTGDKAKEDNIYSSCLLEGDSWRELTGVEGDVMIGCFNYQGKTALYVVNYDYEYAQDVTLHFNENHNVTVVYDAETSHVSAKDLTLPMQAGHGALIVFD